MKFVFDITSCNSVTVGRGRRTRIQLGPVIEWNNVMNNNISNELSKTSIKLEKRATRNISSVFVVVLCCDNLFG